MMEKEDGEGKKDGGAYLYRQKRPYPILTSRFSHILILIFISGVVARSGRGLSVVANQTRANKKRVEWYGGTKVHTYT